MAQGGRGCGNQPYVGLWLSVRCLRSTLIPFFSNPDNEGGSFDSYPIGGPGWEHDIIPPTIPGPDHICTDQDPFCIFPQRWVPISVDGRSVTVECGVHA